MKINKLVLYSDCAFFAGCENMIANLLDSEVIQAKFETYFIFNESIKYLEGLNKRVKSSRKNFIPISLMTAINSQNVLLKFFMRLIFPLLLIIDIVVIYSKLLSIKNIDILHINNGGYPGARSCVAAVFAGRLARVGSIVYVVNNQAVGYKHFSRILDYPFDFFVKKLVSVWVTGSKNSEMHLREVLKINNTKTINNGINQRIYSPDRQEILRRLNIDIDANSVIVGCVGLLEPRKGHIVLLEAIKLLCQKNQNCGLYFIIEGTGGEHKRLSDFILYNNLKCVNIVSIDFDIYMLYGIFDLFVLPSLEKEDFPNVVLEAMSVGLPVIGSQIAGVPEQIVDMETGFLIPPGDSKTLADTIEILENDVLLRKKMGQDAKTRFSNLFTALVSTANYEKLYSNLITKASYND